MQRNQPIDHRESHELFSLSLPLLFNEKEEHTIPKAKAKLLGVDALNIVAEVVSQQLGDEALEHAGHGKPHPPPAGSHGRFKEYSDAVIAFQRAPTILMGTMGRLVLLLLLLLLYLAPTTLMRDKNNFFALPKEGLSIGDIGDLYFSLGKVNDGIYFPIRLQPVKKEGLPP